MSAPSTSPSAAKRTRVPAANPLKMAEAFEVFGAPKRQPAPKVQILRPFAVFSAKAYSTATTLPIGPAYLASTLLAAGYDVDLIDGVGEDILNVRTSPCGRFLLQGLSTERTLERIDPATKILGVSIMFSQSWVQHRELIRDIRRKFPHLIIVVGGEHPTALSEFALRDCPEIDYLITGEGEIAFLDLVHRLHAGKPVGDLPGLCRIDAEGRFHSNGPALRIADFQNLPRPAWHLCPVENYFSGMWSMGIGFGRNMIILATRGCPYQCTFCSNPTMWTPRYLMRPPADVVDEIEWLVKSWGCNSIDFADLTAIVKKEWVVEFCQELIRRKLDVAWQLPSGTRSEALDDETVGLLYEAGCKFLVYAPESGSQATLKAIKKQINLDNVLRSMRSAVKAGHTVKACLIIGFPHEGRSDIFKTLGMAIRLAGTGIGDCNISPFSPYPGSELFEGLRAEGRIPDLNDEYFLSLLGQFDFTSTANYCKNVPGWEVALWRFLGMLAFYGLSYVLHPRRIVNAVRGIVSGDFKPASLAEQRLYDFFARSKLQKKEPA
jgi:anaerobic magnesium-protoporphyrin IX monomethyl ester cyclase